MGRRGPQSATGHLYKRGRIWWCWLWIVRPDGHAQRDARSTGCTDKAAAREVLRRWEREAAVAPRGPPPTLNELLTWFLRDREARARAKNSPLAEGTVDFYEDKILALLDTLGEDYSTANFQNDSAPGHEYIERRRLRGHVQDTTILKELKLLVAALEIAQERGRWNGNIKVVIPPSFKPKGLPNDVWLTRADAPKLFAELPPGRVAVVAFMLATSCEMAAFDNAREGDLDVDLDGPDPKVPIRGTKNDLRDRQVPVVSDEQKMLIDFAKKHADGSEGRLFARWTNIRRDLSDACDRAGIARISPHRLRHSFAKWMQQLGVVPSVVAPLMGHADSRMVERTYGKMRAKDATAALTAALGPEHASRAHSVDRPPVKTLTEIPTPRRGFAVDAEPGVYRTLEDWSALSGIPVSTLHYRVRTKKLSMTQAIALGKGTRGKVIAPSEAPARPEPAACSTIVANSSDCPGYGGQNDNGEPPESSPLPDESAENSVPRGGVEPSTRGFSIRCSTS